MGYFFCPSPDGAASAFFAAGLRGPCGRSSCRPATPLGEDCSPDVAAGFCVPCGLSSWRPCAKAGEPAAMPNAAAVISANASLIPSSPLSTTVKETGPYEPTLGSVTIPGGMSCSSCKIQLVRPRLLDERPLLCGNRRNTFQSSSRCDSWQVIAPHCLLLELGDIPHSMPSAPINRGGRTARWSST